MEDKRWTRVAADSIRPRILKVIVLAALLLASAYEGWSLREQNHSLIQRFYRAQETSTEYLCELDPLDFNPTCKPWPARRASMADFDALCRFYADAGHMSRTPRAVERPLQAGRVFITEVENQIVSSVLTNAETSTLAMIGGVFTPPAHRGKGYASAAMVALCRSLIDDGIRPVLYYDNPAAGGIYRRLGFKDLGLWKSVRLTRREISKPGNQ